MLLSLTFFKITTGACGIAGIRPGSVLIRILFSAGDCGTLLLLIFSDFSGIPTQVLLKIKKGLDTDAFFSIQQSIY